MMNPITHYCRQTTPLDKNGQDPNQYHISYEVSQKWETNTRISRGEASTKTELTANLRKTS